MSSVRLPGVSSGYFCKRCCAAMRRSFESLNSNPFTALNLALSIWRLYMSSKSRYTRRRSGSSGREGELGKKKILNFLRVPLWFISVSPSTRAPDESATHPIELHKVYLSTPYSKGCVRRLTERVSSHHQQPHSEECAAVKPPDSGCLHRLYFLSPSILDETPREYSLVRPGTSYTVLGRYAKEQRQQEPERHPHRESRIGLGYFHR